MMPLSKGSPAYSISVSEKGPNWQEASRITPEVAVHTYLSRAFMLTPRIRAWLFVFAGIDMDDVQKIYLKEPGMKDRLEIIACHESDKWPGSIALRGQ